MELKKSYLDLTLVPLGVLVNMLYHVFLWYKVKTSPLHTVIGLNSVGRRLWVETLMEDTDKKNILAVQTMRNSIMTSTFVATVTILLISGLAAVISSTYNAKEPLNEIIILGSHDEFMVAVKYVTPLVLLLSSFFACSVSIRYLNQVNYLINTPLHEPCLITAEYVTLLLERGSIFNTIGSRALFIAFPLLLWILGPVPVFLCSVALVPILYNIDFIFTSKGAAASKPEVRKEELKSKDYYHIV
eukprot:Gb_18351 [translate_table: standard]